MLAAGIALGFALAGLRLTTTWAPWSVALAVLLLIFYVNRGDRESNARLLCCSMATVFLSTTLLTRAAEIPAAHMGLGVTLLVACILEPLFVALR